MSWKPWVIGASAGVAVLVAGYFVVDGSVYNRAIGLRADIEQYQSQIQVIQEQRTSVLLNSARTVQDYGDVNVEVAQVFATAVSAIESGDQQAVDSSASLILGLGAQQRIPNGIPAQTWNTLQTQIEAQENKLATERRRLNLLIAGWNKLTNGYIAGGFASRHGFHPGQYNHLLYEAPEASLQAPELFD
ncbi:MAG: hypothetical protein AAFR97_08090 [Bacteroidota bacterium]